MKSRQQLEDLRSTLMFCTDAVRITAVQSEMRPLYRVAIHFFCYLGFFCILSLSLMSFKHIFCNVSYHFNFTQKFSDDRMSATEDLHWQLRFAFWWISSFLWIGLHFVYNVCSPKWFLLRQLLCLRMFVFKVLCMLLHVTVKISQEHISILVSF